MKTFCLFVVLIISFGLYNSSIFSSELVVSDVSGLLIPDSQLNDSQTMAPVAYDVEEPGEFLDVDLPDDVKAEKYQNNAGSDGVTLASINIETETNKQPVYSIQVAMFKSEKNAERLRHKLLNSHFRVFIVKRKNLKNEIRYDVRFAKYSSRKQAEVALIKYNTVFKSHGFIVSD